MSGGGGKGGESTSSNQIDPGLTMAARDALDLAGAGAKIPYMPNRGVQFAAFTPQQEAAMKGADVAAAAFGLPSVGDSAGSGGVPAPQTSASGIRGYSTAANYDEMKNQSVTPGMQQAIAQLFADVNTGEGGPGGPLFNAKYSNAPQIQSAGGGGK